MREPGDPREPRKFIVGERDFLLDGEPFRILSGALHYFRVHPGHWADRIRKARQMGLNTVETYVAWNAHAPRPDEFRLDGGLDLGRFLDLVAAEGMFAIVRPGPYICAELTNGGLPGWLRAAGVNAVRSSDPAFMTAVRGYLERLAPRRRLAPDRPGRAGHHDAGRERVRRLRPRPGVPERTGRADPRDRDHRAAEHRRPAGRRHAGQRRPAGRARHRVVRRPRRRSAWPRSAPTRATGR